MIDYLIWIIGILTIITSISVKIIGVPAQIRKNLLKKSTKGISSLFMVLLFISYLLWTIYGILRNDLVIIIGHGVGVITTGIIIYQIIIYKE